MPVAIGEPAPDFTATTDAGVPLSLRDLRGQTAVLYFFPKAFTGGWTTEATEIRDDFGAFERAGATILGCSPDPAETLAAFRAEYRLPFTLLSDPDHRIAEAYGAWGERERDGQKFLGILRGTVIIGPDGRITHVFRQVTPAGHSKQLLEALSSRP
jgi:peroxiredoxin Q/BCP